MAVADFCGGLFHVRIISPVRTGPLIARRSIVRRGGGRGQPFVGRTVKKPERTIADRA
ncbi:hypothetical protein [Methylobacterium sp. 10]|uniref:hypothetical protein n=1 Tax=Methylobacterium sp. 10 TaxID=1101191 RepID=UPI0012DF9D8E|nr:hypothetical protein [Methylobacterium sp. 10]